MSKYQFNIPINEEVKKYLFVILGSSSLALGVVLFLIPNKIVPGGTPGISILLNYFTGYPAGFLMFCVNAPLVLMSIKYIDRGFAIRTLFSIVVSSLVVDILREVLEVHAWTDDAMLGGIFGGIFIGTGLGLLILGNASAGGPSIIARLIADKYKLNQKNVIISLDILIVIIAGIVFQSTESALWSLVSVYATAKSMDTFISGGPTKKIVHISSDKTDKISEAILEKLGRESTILESIGVSYMNNKKVVMAIVESTKIRQIKQIVKEYDEEAVLIVIEGSDLLSK